MRISSTRRSSPWRGRRSSTAPAPGLPSAQPCPAAPGVVESALVSLAATQVDLVRVLGDDNGRYATKYADSRKEYFHDLFPEDYGINKMWVVVRPCT